MEVLTDFRASMLALVSVVVLGVGWLISRAKDAATSTTRSPSPPGLPLHPACAGINAEAVAMIAATKAAVEVLVKATIEEGEDGFPQPRQRRFYDEQARLLTAAVTGQVETQRVLAELLSSLRDSVELLHRRFDRIAPMEEDPERRPHPHHRRRAGDGGT